MFEAGDTFSELGMLNFRGVFFAISQVNIVALLELEPRVWTFIAKISREFKGPLLGVRIPRLLCG